MKSEFFKQINFLVFNFFLQKIKIFHERKMKKLPPICLNSTSFNGGSSIESDSNESVKKNQVKFEIKEIYLRRFLYQKKKKSAKIKKTLK